MERHKCKLCLKKFSNGRALGGPMRSHLLNLPIPPNPHEQEFPIENILSPSSSSASDEEQEQDEEEEKNGYYYGLRENPKRSVRLVDPEFAFTADVGSVVLPDRESETESSKKPTRRRSKRTRKLLEHHQHHHHPQPPKQVLNNNNHNNKSKFQFGKVSKKCESWEPEPVSSISGTTTEEDVAFCLMMLSRDKWKKKEQQHLQKQQQQQDDDDQDEEGEEKSFEETDESDEFKSCKTTTPTTRNRGKYQCETCNKGFKSYQALGGHRASHKKLKLDAPIRETGNVGASGYVAEKKTKIHECPYCFRVFSSGQALGGHKRTHGTNVASMAAIPARSSSKLGDNLSFIDLNLPAPMEDDDVISQFELSAVSSDADFVDHHHRIKP